MKEIQTKIDAEKKALEAKKDMEQAQRDKLAANLERREKELRKAQSVFVI